MLKHAQSMPKRWFQATLLSPKAACEAPEELSKGAQVRQISLANHNASKVSCRFRTEGPYRISMIQQPNHHAVYGATKKKQKDEVSGRLFVPRGLSKNGGQDEIVT